MIKIFEYIGDFDVPKYRIENTEKGEYIRFNSFELLFTKNVKGNLGLSVIAFPDYKLIDEYDTMYEFKIKNPEWFV